MLNLNEDMDDLIRQSAEDYPLKIEGEDWDKVQGAMQSTTVLEEPGERKRDWWLLLLLIPLLVAVSYLYYNNNTQKPVIYSNTSKTDAATENQKAGGSLPKNNESIHKENNPTDPIATGRIPGQQLNNEQGKKSKRIWDRTVIPINKQQ